MILFSLKDLQEICGQKAENELLQSITIKGLKTC